MEKSSFLHGLTEEILEVDPNFLFDRVTTIWGYVEPQYDLWEPFKSSRSRPISGGENVPESAEVAVTRGVDPFGNSNTCSLPNVSLSLVYVVLLFFLMKLLFI